MSRLFLKEFFENESMGKPLFLVQSLKPSGSNFRVYVLVLPDMYQNVLEKGNLISAKLISASVHGLKLLLSFETSTISPRF